MKWSIKIILGGTKPFKQEGEDCGPCYCPPRYHAGKCAPGLKCKRFPMVPDRPGICVRAGNININLFTHIIVKCHCNICFYSYMCSVEKALNNCLTDN